jgi:glycosyltransferase involved in cell wall biosynthesis
MRKVSLMGEKIAEYVSDIPYFSDRMYFIYYLMYEWHARECGGFWGNDIDTEFHRDCIRKYFENYEYVLEEYGSICEYVSVIIPVYNIGKYIGKCLDTVVAQSCHRMEILVVDDGSTDSSRGICDEYAKKDIRIKVLHKENGGLSSARNYGLDIAHGQYIYFLDGDDYINISLIDTCVKSMVKYKADMCIFKTEMITSNGAKPFGNSFEWGQINIEDDVVKYNFLYNKFFTYKYGWEAWNRMFKADIIREHDLRFTSERKIFAEDLLFTSCYMLYTKNIMCITSVLHSYVDREESLMHEKKEKIMIEEFNQLAECFKAELMKTDLSYCKRNFHRLYERIMYWHYGYLFMRVGIKQMRPQLRKIAETDICSKQTNKLLADKKNTIILYGKEDTIRRNGFYRFILNDNLFVYRMNGLLLKGVRLFKAIKK